MNINQKGPTVNPTEHSMKTPTLRAGFFAVLANALRGQGTRALAAGAGPDGPAAHPLNTKSPLPPQLSPNAADNLGVNGVPIDNSERFRPGPGTGERISSFDPAAPAATVRTATPDGTEPLHRLHRHEHSAPANRGRLTATFSAAAFFTLFLLSTTAQPALALPPGRHYEMVSPLFKGGQGATAIKAVAAGGEAVAYYSPGVFAGAPSTPTFGVPPYLARRDEYGWSTVPLIAPLDLVHGRAGDLSPGLDLDFVSGPPGPNAQNEFLRTETLSLHSTSLPDTLEQWGFLGELTAPGEEVSIEYRAASPDFCHVLFYTPEALLAEAEGTGRNEFYRV